MLLSVGGGLGFAACWAKQFMARSNRGHNVHFFMAGILSAFGSLLRRRICGDVNVNGYGMAERPGEPHFSIYTDRCNKRGHIHGSMLFRRPGFATTTGIVRMVVSTMLHLSAALAWTGTTS